MLAFSLREIVESAEFILFAKVVGKLAIYLYYFIN